MPFGFFSVFIYFKLESNLLQGHVPEKARRQAYAVYADVEEEDNDKTEGGRRPES